MSLLFFCFFPTVITFDSFPRLHGPKLPSLRRNFQRSALLSYGVYGVSTVSSLDEECLDAGGSHAVVLLQQSLAAAEADVVARERQVAEAVCAVAASQAQEAAARRGAEEANKATAAIAGALDIIERSVMRRRHLNRCVLIMS